MSELKYDLSNHIMCIFAGVLFSWEFKSKTTGDDDTQYFSILCHYFIAF